MPSERISALGTLGETFLILLRERQLFLLLVAFLSVITLIFLWPILDWYTALFADFSISLEPDPATNQMILDNMGYITLAYIPFIFFMMAPLVLWSRASIGGTGIALEGGISTLLKRTFWVVWRYICLIGWILLLTLALVIIVFIIGMIFGISGAGFSGGDPTLAAGDAAQTMIALLIPFYLIFLIVIFALMILFSVSLHGEARDFRLPIYKAFGHMRGNLMRATGGFLLAVLGFYFIYILFAFVFIGAILSASFWLTIIGLLFMFAFANLYNFMWVTFGALYASKLVPELSN